MALGHYKNSHLAFNLARLTFYTVMQLQRETGNIIKRSISNTQRGSKFAHFAIYSLLHSVLTAWLSFLWHHASGVNAPLLCISPPLLRIIYDPAAPWPVSTIYRAQFYRNSGLFLLSFLWLQLDLFDFSRKVKPTVVPGRIGAKLPFRADFFLQKFINLPYVCTCIVQKLRPFYISSSFFFFLEKVKTRR